MFRYSICDPFEDAPIEMGEIEKEKIMEVLGKFPWMELYDKTIGRESEIQYSPSLEFENKTNGHSVIASLDDSKKDKAFSIFYIRPKVVSKLMSWINQEPQNVESERREQSILDVHAAVEALVNEDYTTLAKRWG
jgi:hypothetical protein